MRRRALLGAITAVTVAGCTGTTDDGPSNESPQSNESPSANESNSTATPSSEAESSESGLTVLDEEAQLVEATAADRLFVLTEGISERSLSHLLDSRGLRSSTEFVSEPDADGPALVEATVTNTSEFERVISPREFHPLDRADSARPEGYADVEPAGTTSEYRRYLIPTADHDFAKTEPAFERDSSGIWRRQTSPYLTVPENIRLEPGESLFGQWAFVGNEEGTDLPIPTGTYSFGLHGGPTIRVWPKSTPGPVEESVHEGHNPPPLPRDADTAWFHEAGPETDIYLHPSQETGPLPMRIEFTLVNHTPETLSGNFSNWALYKLHDGEWHKIAPLAIHHPLHFVPGGEMHTQTLKVFNHHSYNGGTPYLGPGLYAYRTGISDGERTFAVLLEFEGDPVEVTPEPGLTVERDGATVEATQPESESDPERRQTLVTVERVETDTADAVLLPEQVMRPERTALRNAIGLLESDIETVQFETRASGIWSSDFEGEPVVFVSQEGPQPLRITVEDVES